MEAPLHVIISREIIKPSSETPNHLKYLNLSYLDQISPAGYVPIVFFYEPDDHKSQKCISQKLKESLSNTLTSFYPLAGRINKQNAAFIDCNDAGIEFIEARVNARLTDVGVVINDQRSSSNMDHLNQFLPPGGIVTSIVGACLVIIKTTYFSCGGISIGLCMSHRIADCESTMAFINAWAATCKEEAAGHELLFPRLTFDLSVSFPPRDLPEVDFQAVFSSKENLTTARLIFNKQKLASLKQLAAHDRVTTTSTSDVKDIIKDPSRVEVVSAFIWKHIIEMHREKNVEADTAVAALHAVNLRSRAKHLKNVFGNSFMIVIATTPADQACIINDVEESFHDLVRKLRQAFRTINEDYITKGQTGDDYLTDLFGSGISRLAKGEIELLSFSSWCRFPVYEVDFGWGTPMCFFTSLLPWKNSIFLLNNKSGDGIEALVTMPKDYIEMLRYQINLVS